MKCPYCGEKTKWVENKEVYGRNYGKSYMIYFCKPCDAYVGCHNNTRRPLGTIANRELRHLRKECHKLFDKFWKSREYTRKEMYKHLRNIMGMTSKQAHIAKFNEENCNKLLYILKEKEKQNDNETR